MFEGLRRLFFSEKSESRIFNCISTATGTNFHFRYLVYFVNAVSFSVSRPMIPDSIRMRVQESDSVRESLICKGLPIGPLSAEDIIMLDGI